MDLLRTVEGDPTSIVVYNSRPETFPMHAHSKGQLSFFHGGSSHLYTKETTYFVPTDHIVWIPVGEQHRFVHLKQPSIAVRSLYVPRAPTQNPFFDVLGIYQIHPLLKEVFAYCETDVHKKGDGKFELIVATVKLLPELVRDQLMLKLPLTDNPIIQGATLYIHNNLSEPIPLEKLAENAKMGVRTFTRLFQNELGINVHRYIQNARFMRSIELILENKLTFSEIAYEVGYSSLASFSNAFHRLTNKRPSDFKVNP